jgi:hypothetical protein
VSCREINPATMESRKVRGLFFAGGLDTHGLTAVSISKSLFHRMVRGKLSETL